jgi:DNA-binding ferritin-like protein
MSKSQKAVAVNGWAEAQVLERPLLILEKQLMDTLELQWHVQQVRIRSTGQTTAKARSLFEGMASELQTFIGQIRKRLEDRGTENPRIVEMGPSSYWRLFAADSIDTHEQLEVLLCGYAHYARQTSEAITNLRRSDDLESSELLGGIFKAVEQCLWFLEIYLEGLALNTNGIRLPDWPAVAVRE